MRQSTSQKKTRDRVSGKRKKHDVCEIRACVYPLNGWVFCWMVLEVRQVVALVLMVCSGGRPCHHLVVGCLSQGAWPELALGCGLLDISQFPLATVTTRVLHR